MGPNSQQRIDLAKEIARKTLFPLRYGYNRLLKEILMEFNNHYSF